MVPLLEVCVPLRRPCRAQAALGWGSTHRFARWLAARLVAVAAAAPLVCAGADGIDLKFTAGRYAASDGNDATDLNLRAGNGPHTGWVGVYRDRAGFQQWRTGYERRLGDGAVRSVLSLQSASGGALVGSVGAELGGDTFALVGFGRTNRQPYINLNYDPNDMVLVGLGSRAWAGWEGSVFQVRDNRLGTGQRVTHAVLRWHAGDRLRFTLDASAKRGRLDDGRMGSGPGLSLTVDVADAFVRLARDRHAGFAVPDQTRVSAGWRF